MSKKELFIVEGLSASHALGHALDNATQHVYPLQGKLANVRTMSDAAMHANDACVELLQALGGQPGVAYNASNLPYSKVIILMDPDVDGSHSSALVLSFIAKYCQDLVKAGLLFLIKPPKYRHKSENGECLYIASEAELEAALESKADHQSGVTTRFKGVAQFSKQECYDLFLNPESRKEYALV